MHHITRAMFLIVVCLGAIAASNGAFADAPRAGYVLHVQIRDEAITPVTARFLRRALDTAEQTRAGCVVIELDTPGGLLQSTQEIVKSILACRVPVIVYVSPPGGHAASAGLFITLSSHVAAMAPWDTDWCCPSGSAGRLAHRSPAATGRLGIPRRRARV